MSITKVKGSLSDFPYIESHFNVIGPDTDAFDRRKMRIDELQKKRENKRAELIEKEIELHDYIYTIQDSEIRQIFTLRFIDGWTQEEVGRKLHMDRSVISRKISMYLNASEAIIDLN